MGLGVIASLTFTLPTLSEGSQQLGIGSNGLNAWLFEYDATNTFIQANQGSRAIKVNVESANQVINISLCGWSNGGTAAVSDDLAIEVFQPSGAEINYTTQVAATSPGSFSATAASNSGGWLLTKGNAMTTANPTAATVSDVCTNQAKPTTPTGSFTLTYPVRFVAPTAGTYEIRLYNDTEAANSSNDVFTYFDITVTPNITTNPDPKAKNGQLWAQSWAFNAGNGFTTTESYDADFYVRVPGGRPSTEFIWQLDLNQFAPQRHEIIANGIGLDAPNSRGSAPGTTAGAAYTKNYPIYLSPPNSSSFVAPILPEPLPATVTNVRFIDNAGQDNTISPNTTAGVQDSGLFRFDADIAGTYKITIDTNKNGLYDAGDRILFGTATAGSNSVVWDGKGLGGVTLVNGVYKAEILVGLGEYHVVMFDAETSGGGVGNGLSIWKTNGALPRSAVMNYWDDTKITTPTGATRNLIGALSGTAAGSHTWGNFAAGSIGDTNYMDTWVFGDPLALETTAIIAATDANDFGDAPDTYGTNKDTTIGGVPASQLVNTNIYLGAIAPDAELDGQPTVNADGDNVTGTNDEDGVASFNNINTGTTSYSVTVKVKNTTGANAYLGGWIDFNRNGTFEAGEGAVATVANNATTATLNWTGLSGLVVGDTYARFRINDDLLTTSDFKGGGRDGEVEDYKLTIGGVPNVLLVKRITSIQRGTPAVELISATAYVDFTSDVNDTAAGWPTQTATAVKDPTATPDTTNFSTFLQGIVTSGIVKPGDTVEYRIYFLSNGTANAQNVSLCDYIPANSTYVSNSLQLFSSASPAPNPNPALISDTTAGADTDGGFYPIGTTTFPSVCSGGASNGRGAVLVNVGSLLQSSGSGTAGSYGYIRFLTKVN
jgi:uncharacterized repeat protein (TIGR01451 family)